MNRTVLNVVLCGLLLPCAQAVTLRIYPEFTELRRPVMVNNRTLELNFSQMQMANMVGGSLYLIGPKVLSRLQTVNNGKGSLERFEGQVVYLREAGQVHAVRLVRASDGLVQDLKTLRFRSGISLAQLEFTKPLEPDLESTVRYRYTTASSGPATVSLITRGISWQPRYVLSVTDNGSSLEAWADITNHEATLKVDSSELIAGQVELVGSSYMNTSLLDSQIVNPRDNSYGKVSPIVAEAPINSVGQGQEQHGVYKYALSQGYTLPSLSVYSLPFLNAKVSTKRFVRASSYFSSNFRKGKFQRVYQFSSNVLTPAGVVTLRDNGRVLGSQVLPDLSAFEDHDLIMGQDPDVSYTRYVKVANSSRTKTFGDIQREYSYKTHNINLQIKNSKNETVSFEYIESLDPENRYNYNTPVPIQIDFESTQVETEGIERVGRSLKLKGVIPANKTITLKYKVILIGIGSPGFIAKPIIVGPTITTPKSKP